MPAGYFDKTPEFDLAPEVLLARSDAFMYYN